MSDFSLGLLEYCVLNALLCVVLERWNDGAVVDRKSSVGASAHQET
jgi:hypothetical protein